MSDSNSVHVRLQFNIDQIIRLELNLNSTVILELNCDQTVRIVFNSGQTVRLELNSDLTANVNSIFGQIVRAAEFNFRNYHYVRLEFTWFNFLS